jgi:hypothetical protein
MEILENIINPLSIEKIALLSFISTLAYIILLSYLGLLLGSTLLSCMFNVRGRKYKNSHYIKLSKDLMALPALGLFNSIGLIVLPLLIIIFVFVQIVAEQSYLVIYNLIYLVFLLVPAIFMVYIYKDSFELSDISKLVNKTKDETSNKSEEFSIYKFSTIKLLTNSSRLAFYLLFISSYILISGINLMSDSSQWENISSFSEMIFNSSAVILFLEFLSISFSLTSIVALYIYFKPGTYHDMSERKYSDMMKRFLLNTSIIFLLVLPILFLLDVMSVPQVALSNSLFALSVGVLIILLLIVSLLYYIIKENRLEFRGIILFLFIGLFTLLALKIQDSFDTSAQLQIKSILKSNIGNSK